MVLRILFIVICTILFTSMTGQSLEPSVISSSGDYTESKDISIAWTLGEIGIHTIRTDDGMLTEGFHQPILVVQAVDADERIPSDIHSPLELEIAVMPNPVKSILTVNIQSDEDELVLATLLDVTGKSITSLVIDPVISSAQIDVRNLPVGLYLLRFQKIGSESPLQCAMSQINKQKL